MRYLIEHETKLTFAEPVREHHCELRLAPPENVLQTVHRMRIEIEPPAELSHYVDCFGNRVDFFDIVMPHTSLSTRLLVEVETHLENPFDYEPVAVAREPEWISEALRGQPRLWDYVMHRSAAVPDLDSLPAPPSRPPPCGGDRPLIESVCAARDWIGETFDYEKGVTDVHSRLADVFDARAGVCQDFAHLLIAVVRSWGFPARYVMGYHHATDEEDAEPTEQAPHAWAEVLIPGAGWRGFDPTTGLVCNDRYVLVAVGRDYLDAAPQRGSFKGEGDGVPPEVTLRLRPCQQ